MHAAFPERLKIRYNNVIKSLMQGLTTHDNAVNA